jgi:hypothetical protein
MVGQSPVITAAMAVMATIALLLVVMAGGVVYLIKVYL